MKRKEALSAIHRDLLAVLAVVAKYHDGVVCLKTLKMLGFEGFEKEDEIHIYDPMLCSALEELGLAVSGSINETGSVDEINELVDLVREGNQYAFWRLTDLLTPLFRNLYHPNPLYTFNEYVEECAAIVRSVINENPRNFLGVLRLRLRSAGENLCNFYNNPLNIPRSVWRNVNQVSEFCDDYQAEYGQYPSIEEIMEATGFSEKCVKDYLRYATYSPISLNTEVVKEGFDGYDASFTGTVGDNLEDSTWNPEIVYDREHQSELIMEAIMSLTEVEREIILNKCGFDGYDLNRDAVRAKYDLSSRRYAKLLAGALAKLHEALEESIEF